MTNDVDNFRLPPTGVTYPPHKRARRRTFERHLASNPDDLRAVEWLLGFGTYESAEDGGEAHPHTVTYGNNHFLDSIRRGYQEWGSLTERQLAAVRRVYEQTVPPDFRGMTLEEAKAHASGGVVGSYVGEVGERRRFSLTVTRSHCTGADRNKKPVHVTVMSDAEGHEFLYVGGMALGLEGEAVSMRATVKEHGSYRAKAQTVLCDVALEFVRRPRRVFNVPSNQD